MITIIRNDREAMFAHDVYGVKIKEDQKNYKIIGTTRNEGLCVFESCNYAEVARTFNKIIDAISHGEKSVLINPCTVKTMMSKEEFLDRCAVYDTRRIDEDHPIKRTEDLYGRPLTDSCHKVNEPYTRYQPDYYGWNTDERMHGFLDKNSTDNRYLNNVDPFMG